MTYAVSMPEERMFEAWRKTARQAISNDIPPEEIDWSGGNSLFEPRPIPEAHLAREIAVPQQFLKLAQSVIWHSAPERFALLYQALWRLHRQNGHPLSQTDPLGRRLNLMAKAVGRDIHKMHAFVRFRELPSETVRRSFAAWFEPDHHIVEPASPFFAKRFADMDWVIATPNRTARYQDGRLTFSAGSERPKLPEDASEALWATYFANIFNPARVKIGAMLSEMPKKYWANLPETQLIPAMLADAEARVQRMREAGSSATRPGAKQISTRYRARMPQAPDRPATIIEARTGALQCRRCSLCEAATQTVWGEGPNNARLMIVGEQPGDMEDLAGRPFIGPAGQLLRELIQEAGANSNTAYLTNAVKHFKFRSDGKRRLHVTANRTEVQHCRWWLDLEISFIRPRLILALGATAAVALTENDSPMKSRRGTIEQGPDGTDVLLSWHPSYILRSRDETQRKELQRQLREDLEKAFALSLLP